MNYLIILLLFIPTLYAQEFQLTTKQLQELQTQKFIIKKDKDNNSGMIIFDVKKDINSVMRNILNLNSYPEKIEDVSKVEIYLDSYNKVHARVFINTFFLNFDNHVIHDIDRVNHTIKWYLDTKKENFFSKMHGYWKLKKIGKDTRVFYYNKLEFKFWIPSFFKSYLFEEGLFKSTQWLKD